DHTELWAWLEFLKAQSKEELEMLAKEHPTVQPAVTKLLRLSESERARVLYEDREKARRDALSWREEAEMLGEARAQQDIARKLLELGRPVEEVMIATGLSREAVLAMKV
ncbi:MAG: Rpn family recombination-promoting nuclease/putative transposase, partial [Zoogloeaceae bacterium]|nr:Rpn family recombination-promoting nuclease/putative transposase [Zoogloeaceae bacterium]